MRRCFERLQQAARLRFSTLRQEHLGLHQLSRLSIGHRAATSQLSQRSVGALEVSISQASSGAFPLFGARHRGRAACWRLAHAAGRPRIDLRASLCLGALQLRARVGLRWGLSLRPRPCPQLGGGRRRERGRSRLIERRAGAERPDLRCRVHAAHPHDHRERGPTRHATRPPPRRRRRPALQKTQIRVLHPDGVDGLLAQRLDQGTRRCVSIQQRISTLKAHAALSRETLGFKGNPWSALNKARSRLRPSRSRERTVSSLLPTIPAISAMLSSSTSWSTTTER